MSKRLLTAPLTLKELRKKMKPPPANAVCTGPAPMTESEELAAELALQEMLRKNISKMAAAAPGTGQPVSAAAPGGAGARKAKAASRFKSWSSKKAAAVTEAATQASPEAKQCSPDTAVKVRLLPPKGCPSTKGIMVPPSASSVKKKEVPPTPPPGRVTGREVQFIMQGFKRRSGGAKHRKKMIQIIGLLRA